MSANISPIYSRTPDVQVTTGVLSSGNTTVDLTNVHIPSTGNAMMIFQASSSEGGRLDRIVIQPLGTNTATVMRLWYSKANISSTDPSAGANNNAQLRDVTLVGTTVSQVAAIGTVEVQLDLPMPGGGQVWYTIGTSVAAGFAVTGIGGKY
jgi:hypothetical protein